MNAELKPADSRVWASWENQIIHDALPLRRLLGCTDRSAVFLTEPKSEGLPDAAIKFVRADGPQAQAQLAQWEAAAALSHPHLVRLFDKGRHQFEGQAFVFVVMEYADQTLAEILRRRPLSVEELQEMLVPTLDALTFLHRRHLVHGQLKPSNLLAVGDQLKLASDTLRSGGNDAATSDVRSLGLTLVEALTQHRPVEGQFDMDKELPAGLPASLADTMRRCLSPIPADRPTIIELRSHYKSVPPAEARPAAPSVTPAPKPAAPATQSVTLAPAAQSATLVPKSAAPATQLPTSAPAARSATAAPAPAPSAQMTATTAQPATSAARPATPPRQLTAAAAERATPTTQLPTPAAPSATSNPQLTTSAAQSAKPPQPTPAATQPATPAAQKTTLAAQSGTLTPQLSVPPAPAVAKETPPAESSKRDTTLLAVTALLALLVVGWFGLRLATTPDAPLQPAVAPARTPPDAPSPTANAATTEAKRSRAAAPPAGQPASTPEATGNSVVHEVLPEVPDKISKGIQGRIYVTVRVLVDPSGEVAGALMESAGPSKYFARLSENAARQWQFVSADDQRPRVWLLRFKFTSEGVAVRAMEQ